MEVPHDGQQDAVDEVLVAVSGGAGSVWRRGTGDAVALGGLVIVMTAVADMALLWCSQCRRGFLRRCRCCHCCRPCTKKWRLAGDGQDLRRPTDWKARFWLVPVYVEKYVTSLRDIWRREKMFRANGNLYRERKKSRK